jgi:eukaryotic translation initiation factor 2C
VYEIVGIPEGTSKRQSRTVVKTAIQAWKFLRDNEDFFTTDKLKTIVSWKNIHQSIQEPEPITQVSLRGYLCLWQMTSDA